MIAGDRVQREEGACVVEATSLPAAWQVGFRAGGNEGRADTVKDGTGGSAGMRPHEPLEASLATCMTISARMALADLGVRAGRHPELITGQELRRRRAGSSRSGWCRPRVRRLAREHS